MDNQLQLARSSKSFKSFALIAMIGGMASAVISCSSSDPSIPPAQAPGAVAPQATPTPTPTVVGPVALPQGEYGGINALATVSASEVHIQFACAKGDIPGGIQTDSNGTFDVQGAYQSTLGPVPVNGGYPTVSARYFGTLQGNALHLVVEYTDPAGNVQDLAYDVVYQQSPHYTDLCALTATPTPSPSMTP